MVLCAVGYAKAVEVFSPGAWRRSEVGVARSAAERGPDRTPESGTRSPAVGGTEMRLTQEKKKMLHTVEKHLYARL